MKKIIYVLAISYLLTGSILIPTPVGAESIPLQDGRTKAESQLEAVDLSKMQSFISQMDEETRNAFPQLDLANLLDNLKAGKLNLSPQLFFKAIVNLLFREVVLSAGLMSKLVILAVFCGILQHLQNSFSGEVGKVAQVLSYLLLIVIAVTSLTLAVNLGKQTVDQMTEFMQALFPILLTLLVALGNLTSATIFQPLVMGVLSFISTIIKDIVMPLIMLGALLSVVNHVTDSLKVTKLASLLNSAAKLVLGLSLTIFIAVMSVQGVVGSISDGVAIRSAKFATDAFVPVVGRWFSDALELVIGSALLLKNAVGLIGIIVIFLVCILPVLKIVAIMIIYRVAAAMVQPLGNKSLADALQAMSSSLSLVFAAVATVGVMFFLSIAIIVATGNLTVMLR